MKKQLLLFAFVVTCLSINAQKLTYPHHVSFLSLQAEGQMMKMAYMDVKANTPNGTVVLLLHGKNFNGYYWKDVISSLAAAGFRVIVPDQVGWGKSDKPGIHYSFHLLAQNTKQLLDTLGISKVHVVGHSMGGMLAARFALMFPATVHKLILENPIGLEDYRTFVPYQSLDSIYANESRSTYEALKKYQQTYYPVWIPAYEQYVDAQFEAMQLPDFRRAAWASALASQMIYEQPVVYEFRNISSPSLIIIGQEDRTVYGKNLLVKDVAAQHGQYPALGKWLQQQIKDSKLLELQGVGHIPHIQETEKFNRVLIDYLK